MDTGRAGGKGVDKQRCPRPWRQRWGFAARQWLDAHPSLSSPSQRPPPPLINPLPSDPLRPVTRLPTISGRRWASPGRCRVRARLLSGVCGALRSARRLWRARRSRSCWLPRHTCMCSARHAQSVLNKAAPGSPLVMPALIIPHLAQARWSACSCTWHAQADGPHPPTQPPRHALIPTLHRPRGAPAAAAVLLWRAAPHVRRPQRRQQGEKGVGEGGLGARSIA